MVNDGNSSDIPPDLFDTTDTVTVMILACELIIVVPPVVPTFRPKIALVGAALIPVLDVIFPIIELA